MDHTLTMQPSRELNGQNRRPHAWPSESTTRRPSDSAYPTAASIGGLGCHGLLTVGEWY